MKRLLVVLVFLCAVGLASAQVRVVKSAGQKTSIDWSAYQAGDAVGQTFIKVLGDDLLRSGWFTRGTPGQAELALTGQAGQGGAQAIVYERAAWQQVYGKRYPLSAQDARRVAHVVADEIVAAVTGKRGIASGRIALVGTRTGKKELYLMDADGQGLQQLTRDNSVSIAPNWGPGGRQLVYTSYLKGFPDIFLIEVASGARRRVAYYSGLNTGGAISPDGRQMAMVLSKDGNPELYVRDLNGGQLTRLTQTQRSAEASPSWSPDGRQIVYVSDQSGSPQLYIVSRSGGAPRRLTSRGSQNVAPDWGANNAIAYASLFGGRWNISIVDPNGGEPRQITPGDADYEDPSWAPDGRHLVAGRAVRYASRVVLLDTMGDSPIVLTDYPGDWTSPAWAPVQ
ncbi:MAG: PD40 domain-containing protein [Kiritimatiellae bacterium]|nr:PD40 domain-containing protein [Kiritimatiellia bacterium]MCO5069160.1 DPP IV N-terminal domain-containing protein [Kiritimatiellia bacterium]